MVFFVSVFVCVIVSGSKNYVSQFSRKQFSSYNSLISYFSYYPLFKKFSQYLNKKKKDKKKDKTKMSILRK